MKDTVLYLDDEVLNLEGFESSFWQTFNVKTASSVAEAEEILKAAEVKVIISDQKMPDESGLDFFMRIRDQYPETIFIILTGYAQLELVVDALNAGIIFQFLSKPWNKDELERVINNGIQNYNLKIKNRALIDKLEESNKKLESNNLKLEKASDALKKSEEKYIQLFQSIGEGIAVVDNNEIFQFCNRAAEQIFDMEFGKLAGTSFRDFLDEQNLKLVENETQKRKQRLESTYQIKITTSKKQVKYLQVTATPNFNENGEYEGAFGVFRDITQRIVAQNALKESDEKFKTYIDNAPDAISVTNLKGEIIDVNNKAFESLGYSKKEILLKKAWEIDPMFPSQDKTSELWNQLAKNHVIKFETFNFKKDGTSFPVQNNVVAIKQNNEPCFLLFTQDISDRKAAEQKMYESEKRFRTVFESEKLVKIIVDPDNGDIIDANKAALLFYGIEYEDFISQNMFDIHFNPDEDLIKRIKESLTSGHDQFMVKHKLKDGEIRHVEVFTTPVELNNKKYLLNSIIDVTEKMQAGQKLKESEEKFRKFFNQSGDAIFIADAESRKIVDANTTALNWTGMTKEEIIGLPQSKLHPELTNKSADNIFKGHYTKLLDGQPAKTSYSELISKDRGRIPIEISPSIIRLNNKDYLMGIFRDVTIRKRNEQKLMESEQKLIKAQQIAKLGYWQYSFETETLEWSKNTYEIFDVGEDEFTSDLNGFFDFIFPDDVEAVKKEFDNCIKNRTEYKITHRIVTRGNKIKFINERADFFYDDDGNPLYSIGIAQDVSEQVMAQKKLTDSEELLNSMFEHAPFTIALLNEEYEIAKVNKRPHDFIQKDLPFQSCTKVGYVINCVGIKTDTETSMVCENCQITRAFNYTLKTKKPINQQEADVVTFDENHKKSKTFLISTSYLEYDYKPHVLLTLLDISDRKTMEQELLVSKEMASYNERRYQLLSDLSFEGIALLKNGKVVDVNKAFCRMVNYTKNYIVGLNLLTEFFLSKYHELINTKMKLNNSEPFEVMLTRKDGEQVPVEIEIRILNQPGGKIQVVSIRNITERKELANKVLRATIEAEEKERERYAQELHDGLGPLLSNVQMYYQWLAEEEQNIDYVFDKGMKSLKSAFETLREISNNLSPHMLRNFGLGKAIKNFIDNLAKTETVIEFKNNIGEIRFDDTIEVAIYRVVIELINNSLKYAQAQNIQINAWNNDEFIMLEFRDNGKGFNYEEVIKSNEGFGIRNMESRIKTLKGEILFNSKTNVGTSVYINVPLNR